jgi:hypothetical protein
LELKAMSVVTPPSGLARRVVDAVRSRTYALVPPGAFGTSIPAEENATKRPSPLIRVERPTPAPPSAAKVARSVVWVLRFRTKIPSLALDPPGSRFDAWERKATS